MNIFNKTSDESGLPYFGKKPPSLINQQTDKIHKDYSYKDAPDLMSRLDDVQVESHRLDRREKESDRKHYSREDRQQREKESQDAGEGKRSQDMEEKEKTTDTLLDQNKFLIQHKLEHYQKIIASQEEEIKIRAENYRILKEKYSEEINEANEEIINHANQIIKERSQFLEEKHNIEEKNKQAIKELNLKFQRKEFAYHEQIKQMENLLGEETSRQSIKQEAIELTKLEKEKLKEEFDLIEEKNSRLNKENAELIQNLEELKKKNKERADDVRDLESINQELIWMAERLESELKLLKVKETELEQTNSNLHQLEVEVNKLTHTNKEKDKRVKSLEIENKVLSGIVESLESELTQMREQTKTIEEQNFNLQSQVNNFEHASTREQRLGDTNEDFLAKTIKPEPLDLEQSHAMSEMTLNTSFENDPLIESFSPLIAAVDLEKRKKREQTISPILKRSELQENPKASLLASPVGEEKIDVKAYKAQIISLETEIIKAKEEISILSEKEIAYQYKIDELEKDSAGCVSKLEYKTLQDEKEGLMKQVKDLTKKLKAHERDITNPLSLTKELKESRSEIKRMQDEKEKKEEINQDLQTFLMELLEDFKQKEGKILEKLSVVNKKVENQSKSNQSSPTGLSQINNPYKTSSFVELERDEDSLPQFGKRD